MCVFLEPEPNLASGAPPPQFEGVPFFSGRRKKPYKTNEKRHVLNWLLFGFLALVGVGDNKGLIYSQFPIAGSLSE